MIHSININIRSWLGIVALLLIGTCVQAQDQHVSYRYKDGYVIVKFDRIQDTALLNKELETIGSSIDISESLNKTNRKKTTVLGWELISYDEQKIEYKKTIGDLSSGNTPDFIFEEETISKEGKTYGLDVVYGINKFKKTSIIQEEDNVFQFNLSGHPKANSVFLSGTFNNWSTLKTPMNKINGVWTVRVKLKKGKHLYKFIVDGKWMTDPANQSKERDQHRYTNSVFYNYNYTFKLEGFTNAKKVYLAGSFNNWKARQLRMNSTGTAWEFPLYLQEGLHSYKFIVDGKWILDPANPNAGPDGKGNENSLLSFGKEYEFSLRKFSNAKNVVLTGDFNGWNEAELSMTKEENTWTNSIALRPGNYQYKYIVDGRWMTDPDNSHFIGKGDFQNSIVSIEANHTFVLEGYPNAKKVYLTGTFNGWPEDGYTMEQTENGWEIKVHLPKGKTRYKFIVDDKWITDPNNPHWEHNQFGTKDSILWTD